MAFNFREYLKIHELPFLVKTRVILYKACNNGLDPCGLIDLIKEVTFELNLSLLQQQKEQALIGRIIDNDPRDNEIHHSVPMGSKKRPRKVPPRHLEPPKMPIIGICPRCSKPLRGEPVPSCETQKTGRIFYKECSECEYWREVISDNFRVSERGDY